MHMQHMNRTIAVILLLIPLLNARVRGADIQATNLDDTILALALTDPSPGGGYVVVLPKAELDGENVGEAQYIKDSLGRDEAPNTAVINMLVDKLFERNKTSGTRQAVGLNVTSSLTNGYVVDHDGKYAKYLQHDGGSWPRYIKRTLKFTAS